MQISIRTLTAAAGMNAEQAWKVVTEATASTTLPCLGRKDGMHEVEDESSRELPARETQRHHHHSTSCICMLSGRGGGGSLERMYGLTRDASALSRRPRFRNSFPFSYSTPPRSQTASVHYSTAGKHTRGKTSAHETDPKGPRRIAPKLEQSHSREKGSFDGRGAKLTTTSDNDPNLAEWSCHVYK